MTCNRRRKPAFALAHCMGMTSMIRIPTAAAAALLLLAPAASSVAQTTAATPSATVTPITNTDQQFLLKDAQGGAYELAIATLAQQRSSRSDVKAYASRLITDHAAYNQALQELALAKGVTLPTTMTAQDQVRLNSINSQAGSTADASFIEEAIRINAEDKQDAAEEAAKTADPDIKAFLTKFASVDAEHERLALALRK